MGNCTHRTPPVMDNRVLQIKETLKLTSNDIQKFWNVFCKYDKYREGTLTMDTFFIDVLGEQERTEFGDSIFQFIGKSEKDDGDSNLIQFGEFVQAISTFAMFQMEEMARFVFWQFDKEKRSNTIEKQELEFFLEMCHNDSGIKGNIRTALNNLTYEEDKLTFESFQTFLQSYPNILYPAFRLQQNMKLNVMGETWWEHKRKSLQEDRNTLDARAERKRQKEEHRLLRERRRIIQSQMGLLSYCFNNERRKHYEKVHPLPIVYLDEDRDVRVQYDGEQQSQ